MICHKFGFSYTPDKNLPQDGVNRVKSILETIRSQDLKIFSEYSAELYNLRKEYLRDPFKLIGKENLPRYLKLHKKRMKAMRSTAKKITSFQDILNAEEKRRANLQRSIQLIKRSGVDVNKIEELQKKYIQLESNAFSQLEGKEAISASFPASELRTPYTTVTLVPPFSYADDDVDSDHSEEASEPYGHAAADLWGGLIGESQIKVDGADDSDFSIVKTWACCGQEFKAVRDGKLYVSANLRAKCCSQFNGKIERECGLWRDVEVFGDVIIRFCVFNISRPIPHECKVHRLSGKNKHPGLFRLTYAQEPYGFANWNISWWDMGELVHTFEYPYHIECYKDDWIFVTAILITTNKFWSNDFTVKSHLRHVYELINICIRIV